MKRHHLSNNSFKIAIYRQVNKMNEMIALAPNPLNNAAKPISSDALTIREQWWAQLLDKYEPSFTSLIIACNDAFYRYDIFTEMPFAYDMELYDEYMNEAVALALKLSQSLTFLDKQKICVLVTEVANKFFDSPRGLHIEHDFLKEISEVYQVYYNVKHTKE